MLVDMEASDCTACQVVRHVWLQIASISSVLCNFNFVDLNSQLVVGMSVAATDAVL